MKIDGLTGLPLREQLSHDLGPAETPFAVFFDIDGLIWLNDQYGYTFADNSIIRLASVIRDLALSHGYAAYRIGGDEFLVTLKDGSYADAMAFAQSAVDAVSGERLTYARLDDPSRSFIAVNAVVCRTSARLGTGISEALEWMAEQIWKAKGEETRRVGVIADAGDGLPPWAG